VSEKSSRTVPQARSARYGPQARQGAAPVSASTRRAFSASDNGLPTPTWTTPDGVATAPANPATPGRSDARSGLRGEAQHSVAVTVGQPRPTRAPPLTCRICPDAGRRTGRPGRGASAGVGEAHGDGRAAAGGRDDRHAVGNPGQQAGGPP